MIFNITRLIHIYIFFLILWKIIITILSFHYNSISYYIKELYIYIYILSMKEVN